VGKRQTRTWSPVSEKTILDVLCFQRLPQQRIILQIDHAKHEIVTCSPVGMSFSQFICGETSALNGRAGFSVSTQGQGSWTLGGVLLK